MKPSKTPRPSRRQQRRDAIKQLLIDQDSSITSVEFVDEMPTDIEDQWRCQMWLYRKGQSPEAVTVLIDMAEKKILHMLRFEA
jgi:hypothetical protein